MCIYFADYEDNILNIVYFSLIGKVHYEKSGSGNGWIPRNTYLAVWYPPALFLVGSNLL